MFHNLLSDDDDVNDSPISIILEKHVSVKDTNYLVICRLYAKEFAFNLIFILLPVILFTAIWSNPFAHLNLASCDTEGTISYVV